MSEYFPPLDSKTLWGLNIIAQQIAEDPDYLAGSPYLSSDLEVINKMVGNLAVAAEKTTAAAVTEDAGLDKWQKLEKESNYLFQQLKEFGDTVKAGDVAERMSYFRTATSLMEKLVNLQERALGLKQMSVFQSTVMEILDTLCTADQRTEVMTRLRSILNHQVEEKKNVAE